MMDYYVQPGPIRWAQKPARVSAPKVEPDQSSGLPWRDYLTDDERVIIEQAEAAKVTWQALNDRRAGIVNRAIQRARYALGRRGNHSAGVSA